MAELISSYSGVVAFSLAGDKMMVMTNLTYMLQSVVIEYTPVIPSSMALRPLSWNKVTTSHGMPIRMNIFIVALSTPVFAAAVKMQMLGLNSGKKNSPVNSLMNPNLSCFFMRPWIVIISMSSLTATRISSNFALHFLPHCESSQIRTCCCLASP